MELAGVGLILMVKITEETVQSYGEQENRRFEVWGGENRAVELEISSAGFGGWQEKQKE